MPMEITLFVLDNRTKHFNDIKADGESLMDYQNEVEWLINYDRDQVIEDYLRDRFDNVPEINRGYYPRFMGKIIDLIEILKIDKSHVQRFIQLHHDLKHRKPDFDAYWDSKIKTCYLTAISPFPKLMEEISELISLLEDISDKEYKEIILFWL